jgi:hypothetical protein
MKTPGFTAQVALNSRSSQIYREYSSPAASEFAETSETLKQVSLAGFPAGSPLQGGYPGIGFPIGSPSPAGVSGVSVYGPDAPFIPPVVLRPYSPCDNVNCPEGYICVVSNGMATCAMDYQTNNLNCGGPGIMCPSGCCNGTCCPSGTSCCGGTCMDSTDYIKCENCGETCADKTQSCCTGVCISTQTDPENCGQCGNV